MKTDVDSLFFRDTSLAVTASTTLESAVLDTRKNGVDRTKDLIARLHFSAPASLGATSASIKIKTTNTPGTANSWTEIASGTLSATAVDKNNEVKIQLPPSGIKQFLRCDIVKGATALAAAQVVFGGLDADDEYDIDTDLVDDGTQL